MAGDVFGFPMILAACSKVFRGAILPKVQRKRVPRNLTCGVDGGYKQVGEGGGAVALLGVPSAILMVPLCWYPLRLYDSVDYSNTFVIKG